MTRHRNDGLPKRCISNQVFWRASDGGYLIITMMFIVPYSQRGFKGSSIKVRARARIHAHSVAADPSRLAVLFVAYLHPACALLTPCQPGASTPTEWACILARTLTRGADHLILGRTLRPRECADSEVASSSG